MDRVQSLWLELLNRRERAESALEIRKFRRDCAKKLAEWAEHPWAWLSGTDLSGKPLIWTTDELDQDAPVKAFPKLEYLKVYIEVLHERDFVLVDKARQMMISLATLNYIDWHCRFRPHRRWVFSKRTEDEASEMLEDKVRAVHRRLPDWVKEALPQRERPAIRVRYPLSGSYVLGANETVAQGQARGGSASGVFADEAARLDSFGSLIAAALPMCDKFIAVSTAECGRPGARIYKLYINEGKDADPVA